MTKNLASTQNGICDLKNSNKRAFQPVSLKEINLAIFLNKRNGIDPAKISGPYSLLAVMLLVAEILFAIWFYRAESSFERSIAGLIMTIFFVCLMLLVMIMNRTSNKEKKQTAHKSLLTSESVANGKRTFIELFLVLTLSQTPLINAWTSTN
ncbi:MAG: hypothetical protein ACXWM7_07580 [Parachlamydiaceae bacterium]